MLWSVLSETGRNTVTDSTTDNSENVPLRTYQTGSLFLCSDPPVTQLVYMRMSTINDKATHSNFHITITV